MQDCLVATECYGSRRGVEGGSKHAAAGPRQVTRSVAIGYPVGFSTLLSNGALVEKLIDRRRDGL